MEWVENPMVMPRWERTRDNSWDEDSPWWEPEYNGRDDDLLEIEIEEDTND